MKIEKQLDYAKYPKQPNSCFSLSKIDARLAASSPVLVLPLVGRLHAGVAGLVLQQGLRETVESTASPGHGGVCIELGEVLPRPRPSPRPSPGRSDRSRLVARRPDGTCGGRGSALPVHHDGVGQGLGQEQSKLSLAVILD